ncbi:fasciclin domain-containing protein [Marinimicrobium agarilyticum]|uniref:fasciclin domain-containing protein n=1 Tax=Marinimicrobium agarilyticum TaxID=306546 RepID=UPI000409ED32|nr:fasciclin domain-containing protein [Marinimicrobium agarilyticum]
MNMLLRSIGILWLAAGLAACGSDNDDNPPPTPEPEVNTVVDVAIDNGNFTTLVTALEATGLDETLDDPDGTFTVFAPTDDAFALLGEETIAALLEDTDTLSDILLYHVVSGTEIGSAAAIDAAGTTIEMANDDEAGVSLSGENLLINLSMVTITDVEADNGVIHVIDAVMMPPAERGEPDQTIAEIAQDTESLSTLVTALDTADLVTTLDNSEGRFTVFAPTNAAFEMLGAENVQALLNDQEALQSVLLQHVVSGAEVNSVNAYAANGTSVTTAAETDIEVMITEERELTVGGATVTMTDIYATNGVIHVIDAVIVGDLSLPMPSIMDVARSNDDFETLVTLLEATDLDMTLADMESNFTVFAPTDAAFDAVDPDVLAALENDSDLLSDVLLYHVIPGDPIMASAAISVAQSDMSTVEMANEDMAGLSYVGEQLYINTSSVVTANVGAGNGVIHAIDQVMMPPAVTNSELTIAGFAAGNENFSTLVSLLQQENLVATLDDAEGSFTVFAPTNAAFDKIPEEDLSALQANSEALTEVLLSHVVSGAEVDSVTAFTLNGTDVETVSGNMVGIDIVDGMLQVGGATVTMYDVQTTNGIIHVIDTVIMP